MQVLHVSLTELAGMPSRLHRALVAHGVSSRLITFRHVGMFAADIVDPTEAELARQIAAADLVHCHALGTWKLIAPLLHTTPFVVHIHGAPDRGCGYRPAFPHVVVTPDLLDGFPRARLIPNLILPAELPPCAPLLPGAALRIFKSPSLHDKHRALFGAVMQAITSRLADRVHYIAPEGLLRHADLVQLRRSCQVSLDHLHGYYGLESLESLAQGLIAVNGTTEHGLAAFAEIIGQRPPFAIARDAGEVGRLLLTLVEQALSDPPAFEAHRALGPAFIRDHYRPERLIGLWLDLYRELLSSRIAPSDSPGLPLSVDAPYQA